MPNAKMAKLYHVSSVLEFDESMSVFIPRTKIGTLPNISFVKRKPEKLGTEFKNIVDGVSDNRLWLGIQ